MYGEPTRRPASLPTFWTIQLVGWFCFYMSAIVTAVPEFKSGGLWTASVFVLVNFLGSCLLHPVCAALMRRPKSWIRLEALAFVWCVPIGIVAALAVGLIAEHRIPGWVDWLETAVQSSFVLFVWCSLYFSLKLWQQSIDEQERLLRTEAEVRDARLNALRYQLNPHFLFNSLNAVSTLVLDGNAPGATRMLAQIADFMRTILDSDGKSEMPLAHELIYIERYLAIEQTRLGSRLRVETAIAPESLQAIVPAMLLQPIVENAVRHGVAPRVEGATIRISSEVHDSKLHIRVWNSGSVQTPQSQGNGVGVGLRNTAARLKTHYGAACFFASQPALDGWEAIVEVPFICAQ